MVFLLFLYVKTKDDNDGYHNVADIRGPNITTSNINRNVGSISDDKGNCDCNYGDDNGNNNNSYINISNDDRS